MRLLIVASGTGRSGRRGEVVVARRGWSSGAGGDRRRSVTGGLTLTTLFVELVDEFSEFMVPQVHLGIDERNRLGRIS